MEIIEDIIGWDVTNWSRALAFWNSKADFARTSPYALELGAASNNGGLSLWLAAQNCKVVCSGYKGVSDAVVAIHKKYDLESLIEYACVDARSIPYSETFDVVCFKSMLGGIVGEGPMDIAGAAVSEMWRALKPGGKVLFAENIAATRLHRVLRRRFGPGRDQWRYFTTPELLGFFSQFSSTEFVTFGLMGCLGRTEGQRRLLGCVDRYLLDRVVPESWHYVLAGIATK